MRREILSVFSSSWYFTQLLNPTIKLPLVSSTSHPRSYPKPISSNFLVLDRIILDALPLYVSASLDIVFSLTIGLYLPVFSLVSASHIQRDVWLLEFQFGYWLYHSPLENEHVDKNHSGS